MKMICNETDKLHALGFFFISQYGHRESSILPENSLLKREVTFVQTTPRL